MVYEIHATRFGNPYLKRVDRRRYPGEPRGQWMEVGRVGSHGAEEVVRRNKEMGYIVLPDEEGFYRILVLTD